MAINAAYVKLFADLVDAKRWTMDQVPAAYKEAVQEELDARKARTE